MAVPDRTEPAGRGRPGPDPEAPGWYRDPVAEDQLRYWDGIAWTSRRRPQPVWADGAIGGLGPGDPDPVARGREGVASGDIASTGRSDGSGGSRRPGSWSRRTWLLLVVAAVVAATAVGVAGEAMRPQSPGPRVLTDARYVGLANAECARTLPGLRPPDTGPFGQAIPPAQTAAQIDRAVVGLDSLAGRLWALPASPADRPHVDGWLDGWRRYTALGRQYAVFLRERGNAKPGSVLADSVREARAADNFALANHLESCTLFATPLPDPANGF